MMTPSLQLSTAVSTPALYHQYYYCLRLPNFTLLSQTERNGHTRQGLQISNYLPLIISGRFYMKKVVTYNVPPNSCWSELIGVVAISLLAGQHSRLSTQHTLLLLEKRETKTSPLTQSAYRQPLFYLLDQVEKYPGLISCHM